MAKKILTGTLDEQCSFLYNIAQEKMAEGNYTGAVHALKDVVKYKPDFSEAVHLSTEAKLRKGEQTRLVISGFVGAALFIGFGTAWQVSNDLIFLGLALIGAVLGYIVGNLIFGGIKSGIGEQKKFEKIAQ